MRQLCDRREMGGGAACDHLMNNSSSLDTIGRLKVER